MSLYFDFRHTNVEWNVATQFQLVDNISTEKTSTKNIGWIHQDEDTAFSGLIYLTPEIDPSCGTSMFKLKNNLTYDEGDVSVRTDFYSKGIDKNYDEILLHHNDQFVETIKFDNYYNRLITFDPEVYHAANNLYCGDKIRLTQVFFVYGLNSDSSFPLERVKNVKV